jgi:hypothetical protein
MISAEVIKGVHDLLEERGVRQRPEEPFADYVARALDLTDHQAEVLLQSLHDGARVDQAMQAADIKPGISQEGLLVEISRAIGATLGRLRSR